MVRSSVIDFLSKINSDSDMFSMIVKLKEEYKKGDLSKEESYYFFKNRLIPFAKEKGYEFSINDLVIQNKKIVLLSDDSLAEVSGGIEALNKKFLSLGLCGLNVFSTVGGVVPQITNPVSAAPSDGQDLITDVNVVNEAITFAMDNPNKDNIEKLIKIYNSTIDEYKLNIYRHLGYLSNLGNINAFRALENINNKESSKYDDDKIISTKELANNSKLKSEIDEYNANLDKEFEDYMKELF